MARFKMVPVYKGRFSRKSDRPPQLAPLNLTQQQVLAASNVGLEHMKARLVSGRDEHDAPYPPLNRRYAKWKQRATKIAKASRDFKLGVYRAKGPKYLKPKHPEDTLLGNLRIRKVSEVMAEARNSTKPARETAGGLNNLYQRMGRKGWLLWSPGDLEALGDGFMRTVGSPVRVIFKNFLVSK